MHRQSMLFLIILALLAALAVYEAFSRFQAPAAFTRYLGISSFFLLCVSLSLGPLTILGHRHFSGLIEPRRAVGLAAFALMAGHIAIAAGGEYGWDMGAMLQMFQIQLAVPAAFLMTVLALTSSDYAVKALGPSLWKKIQMLNYAVFPLALAHFLLSATGLSSGGGAPDLAELSALMAGIAAIALQLCGFFVRRAKKAEWLARSAGARKEPGGEVSPPGPARP
jgi:DMSO/TMAO reductase YedYZ heme-binding membrane subunit